MPSSSTSKFNKVLSKRRPRHNIIAMILKSAKGSGSSGGGSNTTPSRSTKAGSANQIGENINASSNSRNKKPSRSRAIIQSAVDLTGKLSKRATTKRHARDGKGRRTSSSSGSIVKGQKAFYRSSKGICKVTVVGVHHDAKLEPYYTIRLKDGKEKQVDGKQLTPIQELDNSIQKDSSHGEKSDGIKKVSSHGEIGGGVSRRESTSGKVHAVDVSVTDQMSDSSSEGGSAAGSLSPSSDLEGSFATGQFAYYLSSDGHITKVKIMKVYPSSSKYQYGVDLPDGTSKDVSADRLKAVMDLTSDELAVLMKEKNEKPRPNEMLALPSTEDLDRGYEAEKSDSSQETTEQESSNSKQQQQQQQPAMDPLALPCSVEMVEAKTEDGGTKIVPKYAVETKLYYKNAQGIQKATILDSHLDDLLDPYYSIRLEDGREKQTDNSHLMLTLPVGMDAEERTEEKQEDMNKETEVVEEPKEGESPDSDTRVENTNDTSAKHETTAEDELALVLVDVAKKSETVTDAVNSDVGKETTPQVKKQVDPAAYALVLVHTFSMGEEVLYSSSQGGHFRATVVKLLKDKKHRPYYVVRLPEGKEKQVYDHRLSPLRIGRADSPVDKPRRSGRSRSSTRRRARSEAPSSSRRSLKRSDSNDTRGTTSTLNRRASVSSSEKLKSISRSKSLSRRSASRGPRSQRTSRSRSISRSQAANEDSRPRMKSLRKSIR